MESRFRTPIHPAFTHFPVALWTTTVILDLASFRMGNMLVHGAFYTAFIGCLFALPTALAGLYDYTRLDAGSPARQEGFIHALMMLVATLYFIANTWLRSLQLRAPHTSGLTLALAIIGLIGLFIAGWLGHRLVVHYGANVMVPRREPFVRRVPVRP